MPTDRCDGTYCIRNDECLTDFCQSFRCGGLVQINSTFEESEEVETAEYCINDATAADRRCAGLVCEISAQCVTANCDDGICMPPLRAEIGDDGIGGGVIGGIALGSLAFIIVFAFLVRYFICTKDSSQSSDEEKGSNRELKYLVSADDAIEADDVEIKKDVDEEKGDDQTHMSQLMDREATQMDLKKDDDSMIVLNNDKPEI